MTPKSQINKCSASAITVMLLSVACRIATSAPMTDTSASIAQQGQFILVNTTSGPLRGLGQIIGQQGNGSFEPSVFRFLSVPYGQPPVGQMRFMIPQPFQQSSSVIDTTQFGPTCSQLRHLTRFISPLLNIDSEHRTSEDCLHLHIYAPSSAVLEAESSKLPVIVWIPGEGFDFADARQFDGSHLAQRTNSVVVSVQYRVGAFGFMRAPELGIEGNMGIHDQILALKWVHQNIANFGGNSSQVSLLGRFSGSMSISALVTAPRQDLIKMDGQLLFNRIGLLSGVAVDDWIIDSQPGRRVDELVRTLKSEGLCNGTDKIQLIDCMKRLDVDVMLRTAGWGWRLTVDNQLVGHVSPIDAIRSNQFASGIDGVLVGETGMEGTICLYRHVLNERQTNFAKLIHEDRVSTSDLFDMIRDDSMLYFNYNLTRSTNPVQSLLETVLGEQLNVDQRLASAELANEQTLSTGGGLRDKYLEACSSYMIKSHSSRLKRNILERNQEADFRLTKRPVDVFHYELRYKPSFSLAPAYIKTAAHGDDIPLIFGLIFNKPTSQIDQADKLMTKKMMAYVGNFIHGNSPSLAQPEENSITIDASPSTKTIVRSWTEEGLIDTVQLEERESAQLSKDIQVRLVLRAGQQPPQVSNEINYQKQQKLSYAISPSDFQSGSQKIDGNFPRNESSHQRNHQQPTMVLVNETSLMTLLVVLGSCMPLFALLPLCLGFCFLLSRYNLFIGHKGTSTTHRSSSSSCNICDDSQPSNVIDSDFPGLKRKSIGNMLAKLGHRQQELPVAIQNGHTHTTPSSGHIVRQPNHQSHSDMAECL